MAKAKTFPRKPFAFGKYIVEYQEEPKSPHNFLKEELNTQEEAAAAADRLKELGYNKVEIKKIG
jgi:hypothetical protein|tara:strand:- start:1249 stop:1440 length:192 start_codon:yes stop_codon:yes gene_type:complete